MEDPSFLPPPPDDPRSPEKDLCRLWIGNLDPKLTEYVLLKMLQKTGITLKHYDFLYHKAGPDKGKPRGYCFITVSTPDEAVRVVECWDGKMVFSRKLVVRIANVDNKDEEPSKKPAVTETPASNVAKHTTNKESKIKAIEAKLRLMEENSDVSAFLAAPNVSVIPPVANTVTTNGTRRDNESRHRRDNHQYHRVRRPRAPYSRHRT